MPVELIIAIVVIVAWRIVAGMKVPVLSPILRALWNLSFTVSSFIPFFGWAANFIIADTEEELRQKEDMIEVGETVDDLVSDAFGGGSSTGGYQTGDIVRDNSGNTYRVRREGHLVYLTGSNGAEKVIDTDFADIDDQSSFTYDGVHYTK